MLLLGLAFGRPVLADDTFTVPNVKVDISADNASAARDQGIVAAQRQAFEQLAANLKPGGAVPKLSDDKISDLVRDFAVENEQSGGNRYVGSMTVRFRPGATRAVLNVPATASPATAQAAANTASGMNDSAPGPAETGTIGTVNTPAAAAAPQNFLYVVVPAQNAKQLNDQRQNFMRVPGIAVADIAQLNKTASTLRLGYNGSADTVLTNMVSRGIALKQRPLDAGDKIAVFELTSLTQNHL